MNLVNSYRFGAAPLEPPSTNLQNWWTFRTADVTLNGSNISGVTDRQGHTNLTQATANKQPAHVLSGINGNPIARFSTGAIEFANLRVWPCSHIWFILTDSWLH